MFKQDEYVRLYLTEEFNLL